MISFCHSRIQLVLSWKITGFWTLMLQLLWLWVCCWRRLGIKLLCLTKQSIYLLLGVQVIWKLRQDQILLFNVNLLARFSANPQPEHWTALKHLSCYLPGKKRWWCLIWEQQFWWRSWSLLKCFVTQTGVERILNIHMVMWYSCLVVPLDGCLNHIKPSFHAWRLAFGSYVLSVIS